MLIDQHLSSGLDNFKIEESQSADTLRTIPLTSIPGLVIMRVPLKIIHTSSEQYTTVIIINVSGSFWYISHFRCTSIGNRYASISRKIAIYTVRQTLPVGGVTVRRSTEKLRNYGGNSGVLWKESFYGKSDMLGDAENAARWCGCNLVL